MSLKIDGGILAGGLSTRMEGNDKGLQKFQDKAMAKWVYQALEPFVDKIYINCNRNHALYEVISSHTCSDTITGYQGPLAGVISLMSASSADYLLISPCDTPLLGASYGKRMLQVLDSKLKENTEKRILIASKTKDRNHPLHLLISRNYRESLEQALREGNNRVMKWMNDNDATWVDFSEDAASDNTQYFVNFNSLEDLKKAN